MKDAILAVALNLLGGNFSGQLAPKIASVGQTINYTYTNQSQVGCHNYDCCIACGEPIFDCLNFCEPAWKKKYVACVPTNQVTGKRDLYVGGFASYCADCQAVPTGVECKCEGFPATEFTSSGFNSRNNLSTGSGGCGGGGTTETFPIASKLETIVTGNKTVQMRKNLSVSQSIASVPDVYPACILLTLKFQILGSTTGSCADNVNMTVTYQSVWNGSDTVMQYLAKPMKLQAIGWGYDICPNQHPLNGDQNVCGGFDIGSFKDADCGWCYSASGYIIDYVEVGYNILRFDNVCPPLTLNTVIDPVFQPWQTVPQTVQPLA